MVKSHKHKILNDPVWGFIDLDSGLIFDLIEHPFFQRLRRIRQLGFTSLVYSGANHTRFEHSIGSMHLVRTALQVLREKGVEISPEEAEAVTVAVLLHDLGHGPFSHALEESIVQGIGHEDLSLLFMQELNRSLEGRLDLAIDIFLGKYPRRFLHLLVSSQLDMDRLDFLKRDSFYCGVSEGVVSSDRIIKMLDVRNDQLVVEAKGIYSVEKFLLARRMMYWQVYLHKTVVAAERMLVNLLRRASELAGMGQPILAQGSLGDFLEKKIVASDFRSADPQLREKALRQYASLDDSDVVATLKGWLNHPDPILSELSDRILNRKLMKVKVSTHPFSETRIAEIRERFVSEHPFKAVDTDYFLSVGEMSNKAYQPGEEAILILYKNGKLKDIRDASDINLEGLTKTVRKHFVCYPVKKSLGM
ncbi:MAG: HD domain-containing protein [Marinilabiliales bacterium]|nr:HD domain-containing protein [Marinilabiliales bacterium]